MKPPALCVVVLTLNEERNIGACLASLARQSCQEFEVVVIDAASSDGTLDIVHRAQAGFPVPLRLEAATTRLPIGEARNHGVALAQAPNVAFLSADAELDPEWIDQALCSLTQYDLVFSRQLHAPHAWTLGAAIRGLRYHFPDRPTTRPLRYASNVAAAYKKEVLEAHPFDTWANAAEDLLLAKRAERDGYHATYNPRMVVHHHDVTHLREEMRKNVREGRGCAIYADELGHQPMLLAWGVAVVAALVAAFFAPIALPFLALVLWAPALRRVWYRRHHIPPGPLAAAAAATPFFDLAFLANYLIGLVAGRTPMRHSTQEMQG